MTAAPTPTNGPLASCGGRVRIGELDADDVVYLFDAGARPELLGLDQMHQIMVGDGLDALLVGRDLSGTRTHKRAGNYARSVWSSLWAGGHLPAVESGYQIFRIGALVHALDYCRGYGYPEIVELAVVLKRLGYRVRADLLAPMPANRSRTRIKDVASDLTTIPRAAWRSTPTARHRRALACVGAPCRRHRRAGCGRHRAPRQPPQAVNDVSSPSLNSCVP